MAFNRIFHFEFRTWKHYRGMAGYDVWLYDFKTGATENLTNNPAPEHLPDVGTGQQDPISFLTGTTG